MGATCQTSTSGRVHADYSGARVSRAFCRKARIVPGCVCIGLNTESPVSRKGQCRSIQRVHAVPPQRGCKHAGFPVGKLSVIDTTSLGSGRACTASATAASEIVPGLRYDHVMIALMDDNPFLSDGSKQVLATTAALANVNNSRLTVLMVDKAASGAEGTSWIEAASWHLKEHGYDPSSAAFQEVSLDSEETHNSSVVVGDAVDQVEADLVVLSAEAVHTKKVDCNLLAEFCTAPVLLLP
ncbi:hypothetical protein CVIRNUC_010825 [Coccomyxa viridis]|uniref:Universal stress protein n=1 Tax=Coccomyxa viridis TaxID=1274662 RepID=A0AAV1INH2_9CHLO|nr:hypothetical protein CVIRNUC_010825 [Coccomyxa viridis]